MDRRVVRWFDSERGISEETLTAFGIDFRDGLLRYPYSNGIKLRTAPWEEGERKIWWEEYPGKDNIEMFQHPAETTLQKTAIIVEGESDTMKLWQELTAAGPSRVSVRGLSGLSNWQSRYAQALEDSDIVYAVLDNEKAYRSSPGERNAADDVEDCWRRMKADLGRKVRRVYLPPGIKDVCEFFQTYSLEAFRELVKSATNHRFHYKPLDLTEDLEDVEWLVHGLFALGDAAMIYGPGGVGKSWYTMSLATAIVEGWETWLGMEIPEAVRGGRVVYVDEENPEDVFRRRWSQLGYTRGNRQLHPLWYPGVRLDSEPEKLYEDVEAIEPVLVVVDSLSRIHTQNENASEEMNPLLNDGILPMARRLGTSVLTIHHTPHDSARARGSTVLGNAHDMTVGIDWRKTKKGERMESIIIRPDKLRRVGIKPYLETKIVDTVPNPIPDEPALRVEIQTLNSEEDMPF